MPRLALSSGVTIHFLEENRQGAATVLLLHGLGATSGSWQEVMRWLGESGFRVLAPDMPGFGDSSYPGHTSIAEMARDTAELLERLEAGPAHVVGISLGGTVAQQLALDHPRRVRSLVLINTFARLCPEGLRAWVYFMLRLFLVHTLGLGVQARLVGRYMFPRPEQAELRRQLYEQVIRANPRAYRATMRALWRFDVEERLSEIKTPTLIVTGAQDTTVSPKNQQILVAQIAGARHVAVANANHAVPADQPEEFRRVLAEFLASLS
jgi:3-oxoadipate enol-lactonase